MTADVVDGFLGGRVKVVQPRDGGHRAGLEAVLLGAAVPADAVGTLVDLGAGTGVAGLVAAARCPALTVVLVEIDRLAASQARLSVALDPQRLAERVRVVEADATASAADHAEVGLLPAMAAHVIINPPFHQADRTRPSPDPARARAHRAEPNDLDRWLKTAARLLDPRGRLTVIFRADEVPRLLAAVGARFGGIALMPVHPRSDAPASRVLLSARPQSRAPFTLLPPLVLHDAAGGWTTAADAVLRDGAGLVV